MIVKKKKGSSLLSVVTIFAVLITAGTALISLTLSDYKARIIESKKTENLYNSESGLEEAYGIISKVSEEALKVGNEAVENYMQELNGDESNKGILDQEKENFKNIKNYKSPYLNKDGSIDESYISKEQNRLFKESYKNYVTNNLISIIEERNGIIDIKDKQVSIITSKDAIKFNESEVLNLRLESSFYSKDINSNEEKYLRKVQATFNIASVDYNRPYSLQTQKILLPIYNLWSKAIVVGGDLQVRGNFNLMGDGFVRGDNKNAQGVGVQLVDSNTKLQLEGNLVSLKDIRLGGSNNNLTMNSNYSIYTGSLAIDREANNSNIDIKGVVYANNDLVLNAKGSKINIFNGFYGINDVPKTSIFGESDKNSSSILVNAEDLGRGSSITIGKELILMGTAYIKTKEVYQTGESVAIRGNYRAYTFPLKDTKDRKLSEDKVLFEYLDPLQLVTRFKESNSELLYDDKAKYFEKYAEEYGSNSNLKLEGIELPEGNIINIGAIISKGKILKSQFISDDLEIVKEKKKDFTTASNEIQPISNEIDFNSLTSDINSVKYYNGEKEVLYVSKEEKPLYLIGAGAALTDNEGDNITLSPSGKGRGIVITNGDVYLKGNIDFIGTIITKGNIIVLDKEDKSIEYDGNYVKQVMALNYDNLKGLFKGTYSNQQVVEISSSIQSENNVNNANVRSKLVTATNWKIVK